MVPFAKAICAALGNSRELEAIQDCFIISANESEYQFRRKEMTRQPMTVLCNLGILLVWRFYLLHFTQRTMGSVTKLVIFYTEGNRTAHYLIEQSAAVRSCGGIQGSNFSRKVRMGHIFVGVNFCSARSTRLHRTAIG